MKQKWLKEFGNRINIGIGTFIVSAIIALVIALLTLSFLSIKEALPNPIESLRYE